MRPRLRRICVAVAAVAVMIAVVAAARDKDTPTHTFRVTFGLTDKAAADWNGQLAVAGGEATTLTGWRFEDKDAVEGASAWKCKTREYVAPGERFVFPPAMGKPKEPAKEPWANGVTLTVKGAKPTLTLTLPKGEVKFDAADVALGEPKTFLDGAVRVERIPEQTVLRPMAPPKTADAVQDDYPAFWVRYKTRKQYLAWVAYQKEKDRVLLVERDGPDGEWSAPVEVDGPGDHFRVALASTHNDTLWITYAAQRDKKWNLFGRPYKDGKLGEEKQITNTPGPNIWHRMTTDQRGRAWLVWQGIRLDSGTSSIYAACVDGDGWHEAGEVTNRPAVDDHLSHDWDPTIVADYKEDRVWIGWDTYDGGRYGIRVRSLISGKGPKPIMGDLLTPAETPKFGAHVSLASDRAGRLWAAWDEAGPQWGKDTGYLYKDAGGSGLYQERSIRVKCLVDGKWLRPTAPFEAILPRDMKDFNELPQLQDDGQGRIWMAWRHRNSRNPRADNWAANGRWDVYATAFLGDRWLPPIPLENTAGRNDMRTSSQRDPDGNIYFACATDNRVWFPASGLPRQLTINVNRLSNAAKPGEMKLEEEKPDPNPGRLVHANERYQVARIRGHRIEQSGKTYRIYRGDLHRHTDISTDGVGDGSLMDLHRYAIDAAALDFILVGDHNMGNDVEYNWWRTQKANDLYTIPGKFISLYGYERSVPYPNGHRNVIWPERGHRTLPLPNAAIPAQMAGDTAKLYAELRRTGGICTLHTSATGQGTNWEQEIDPEIEPFVEIFQGFHASFEAPGAPRIVDANSDTVHTSYKADGYVSMALDKGYKLGFQASSDHVSTHVSYCCVLAEEFSRKGLVEAMKKRHVYGATDNIVLDVRMGTLGIMGDEVKTAKPQLDVVVLGTGPIESVDVIRNGKVLHSEKPAKDAAQVKFHWDDAAPIKGEKPSYYYVRVLQKNGQMAWASPFWVRVTE